MVKEIPKSYETSVVEARWYRWWEEKGYFGAGPDSAKDSYSIVIPPPNVTGALHMGHALIITLQDIIIRWKRMRGFNVLWLPGTDHAGIATQNVVERQLAEEGKKRTDLGRAEFEKLVWRWKEKAEKQILVKSGDLAALVTGAGLVSLSTMDCPRRCGRFLSSSTRRV